MPSEMPSLSQPPDDRQDWVNLHVCQRLKAKRILRGMSQERVARALGISYQQLQRYESGKSRLPCSLMYRAAQALEVPITYFFETIAGDRTGQREQDLDSAALSALRNIQNLRDGETRQSLLRLIADLAREPRVVQTG